MSGTTERSEEDWHAFLDLAGAPPGPINDRMRQWINARLASATSSLAGAVQSVNDATEAFDFFSISCSCGGSLQFSDARNSQYVALTFEDF
jgi:hypothetical protein